MSDTLRLLLGTVGDSRHCAHRSRYCPGKRCGSARHALDHRIPCLEHAVDIEWSARADRLTQRVLGRNHLHAGRLAVVPFGTVARTIGTHDAVPGSNLMPELRLRRPGCPDATHVDREPIAVQRLEFVGKTANAECRRSISRENSGGWQSGISGLPNRVCHSDDEFRMQATNCEVGALQRHCIAWLRRLNHICASLRNLLHCPRGRFTPEIAVFAYPCILTRNHSIGLECLCLPRCGPAKHQNG